jgi:hypothetical protein
METDHYEQSAKKVAKTRDFETPANRVKQYIDQDRAVGRLILHIYDKRRP